MPRPLRNPLLVLLWVVAMGLWKWAPTPRQWTATVRHGTETRLVDGEAGGDGSDGRVDMGPATDGVTKHLVVATLEGDDTSWIQKRLLGWGTSIYVADNPAAALTVPTNKGREAQVYLT